MNIIVVIPAYHESHTLGAVVDTCRKYSDEVIVVDDGSADETASIARARGAHGLTHLVNRGYGAALKTGIMAALQRGADIVVTIDADGQHDPSEITRLIQPIIACTGERPFARTTVSESPDIVIGSRFHADSRQYGMSYYRKTLIFFGNVFTWLLYGVWLSDTQSGFRAYTRDALLRLHLEAEGMEFSSEVIGEAARAGMRIALVPITVRYTDYSLGKGQNVLKGIGTAFRLLVRRITRL